MIKQSTSLAMILLCAGQLYAEQVGRAYFYMGDYDSAVQGKIF
jgi:hypothetical protein